MKPIYWKLSSCGGVDSRRMIIDIEDDKWLFHYSYVLSGGGVIDGLVWNMPMCVIKQMPRAEDMPWSFGGVDLVSDRIKAVWEREAPDCVQFLPVELRGPGSDCCSYSYWAVNWLKKLDWLHEASYQEDETGRSVHIPILDSAKIDHREQMGVLQDFHPMRIVSGRIRSIMKKSGITGPFYDRVPMI